MANNELKPNSLNAAQDVLMDLKNKAAQAEKANDAFTFGLMNQLIRVVSPIVTRAHARLLREEAAALNKTHKDLKAKARESSNTQRPHLTRE